MRQFRTSNCFPFCNICSIKLAIGFRFNVSLIKITNLISRGSILWASTMARLDIAPDAFVPLHSHLGASDVNILLKGYLFVGFVDVFDRLFARQLRPGYCFVFLKGSFIISKAWKKRKQHYLFMGSAAKTMAYKFHALPHLCQNQNFLMKFPRKHVRFKVLMWLK